MNNYEFCAQWIIQQAANKSIRVLDYGCGGGQIINELKRQNVEAFGCDVFYEGGDYSDLISSQLLDGTIKRMTGDTIPFAAGSFDFIINNQVMEHVENLDVVLAEFDRVLKPGGEVLSLFPDKSVWREGHCGIAFLHWFPKNSTARIYFAAMFRLLGFGRHKGNKTVMQWSQDFCEWLDKWTFYRPKNEINACYEHYFRDIKYIEDYWLQLRLGAKKSMVTWLPGSIQKLVVRKLGGMIFVAHKAA